MCIIAAYDKQQQHQPTSNTGHGSLWLVFTVNRAAWCQMSAAQTTTSLFQQEENKTTWLHYSGWLLYAKFIGIGDKFEHDFIYIYKKLSLVPNLQPIGSAQCCTNGRPAHTMELAFLPPLPGLLKKSYWRKIFFINLRWFSPSTTAP